MRRLRAWWWWTKLEWTCWAIGWMALRASMIGTAAEMSALVAAIRVEKAARRPPPHMTDAPVVPLGIIRVARAREREERH